MHALDYSPEQFVLAPYGQPKTEAALYHDQRRHGYFTIGYSTAQGRQAASEAYRRKEADQTFNPAELGAGYRQRSFRLREMPRVLDSLPRHLKLVDPPETTDFWISQGEFTKPNRQKINLSHIAVCWVDLDLHHENSPARLRGLTRDKALAKVLALSRDRGIPEPSMVLWTGRGLAVKWYTDVLPKAAYPRWAAVQTALVEAFADLGADAQARDASRILRVAGSYNHKSGEKCEPLYINEYFGEVHRVSFDDLANAVLPFTRERLAELREQREYARKARKLGHHLQALEGGKKQSGNLLAFNPLRLAWLQVDDYRKLAALRPVGQRPEGWTNTLVWLTTSALAVAVWADADRWEAELPALAKEIAPHWPDSRIVQATSSVQVRMEAMARGEWVVWQGKKRPPVYTPSHEYILDALGVTDAEVAQLSAIVPENVARERTRERDRIRNELRRREAGVMPRAQWIESHGQERTKPWEKLGISRMTWFRRGKPNA